MKRPRPFNHQPIYFDSSKERLQQVEQRAKYELGLAPASAYIPADLHGVFSAAQHRRKSGVTWLSIPMILSVVLIIAAVTAVVVFSH